MNPETISIPVKKAEVALYETNHYIRRKKERKFESSILGRVIPRLCNLKVGQMAKFSDGAVTVICCRTSSLGAVLVTGYKKGQILSRREQMMSNYSTMSVRMSEGA